jgi:hypothetical protein
MHHRPAACAEGWPFDRWQLRPDCSSLFGCIRALSCAAAEQLRTANIPHINMLTAALRLASPCL